MEKDQLIEYYQKELTYLRHLGAEFSEIHDDIAGKLKLDKNECNDPHTERIIEAFAFLSARIHKKIDDHFPEIIESLFDIIYPEYNRPLPSMAVVELNPGDNITKLENTGYLIDRDVKLFSKTMDNEPACNFKTCYPVQLYPVQLHKISHKKDGNEESISIEIVSKKPKTSFQAMDMNSLRFFIAGTSHSVFKIYEALFHNNGIRCEILTETEKKIELKEKLNFSPVGFDNNESLLADQTKRTFPGYRLLYELFAYPEKFLFFDIKGFHQLKKYTKAKDRLIIHIDLKQALDKTITISNDTFRLNATPIINLYEKKDVRLRLNPYQTEFHIVPDSKNRMTTEIFSLDKVQTSEPTPRKKQIVYCSYYSTDHKMTSDDSKKTVFYQTKRKASPHFEDNGTELFISFRNPKDKKVLPKQDLLLLNVTCTNRDAPKDLHFHSSSKNDFRIEKPFVETVKCILKPTRTRRPFKDGGLQWRLLSHLSLNYLSLLDVDTLKEILRLYNFDHSKASQQQIEGITKVSYEHVTRRINNRSFCRGIQVMIEFNEQQYVGKKSMILFASIIERFLGQYVSINSFSQLVAISAQTSENIYEWPPRSGDMIII